MTTVEELKDVLESGTIFDIMEARDCLEYKCAQLAAVRADPAQIRKMKNAIKKMQENGTDIQSISKADLEFHLMLAEASGNDVICEIMKLLIEKMELYADKFWATLPSVREKAISTACYRGRIVIIKAQTWLLGLYKPKKQSQERRCIKEIFASVYWSLCKLFTNLSFLIGKEGA